MVQNFCSDLCYLFIWDRSDKVNEYSRHIDGWMGIELGYIGDKKKKGELKEDMMDEWADGGCHSREKRETKDMEQWRKILKVRKTKME